MIGDAIRLGSRGSALARAQARLVADALERAGRRVRLVVVETEGDRRAPDTAWGEGAFVAAIERALIDGRIDAAVHSAKDIPTGEDVRLRIAAYLERADPRDALVLRDGGTGGLEELPPRSRVGTDSPRRTGFLLARRPDLGLHPLHGNVDTRLRRLDAGETDALVLACAGLDRLGLGARISQRLDPEHVPPAPGQGAVAVQVRADDAQTLALVSAIDHGDTRVAVEAERAFLAASGGGCRAPIGALATVAGDELTLLGGHASPDGSEAAVARRRGRRTAGARLARELVAELGWRPGTPSGADLPPQSAVSQRVLVARASEQAGALESALRGVGLDPVVVPAIAVEFEPGGSALDAATRQLHAYAWVVITSTNGARAFFKAAGRDATPFEASRFAAIGPTTRAALEVDGIDVAFQPSESTSAAMAAELPVIPGHRVLVVRGDLADGGLATALRARGAQVDDVIAYRTREAPESSRPLLRSALADGPIEAVILTSGSTVRGLVALAGAETLEVTTIPAVCIGPETAAAARRAGFGVLAVAPTPEAVALAAATSDALTSQEREIP